MSNKIITLTVEELSLCKEFSIKSAKSQQAIEFGQSDTKARALSEIARDNLIGKMAEVAFARMLKEDFNLEIPLDFEIYSRGKWDDNDIIINGWNIDIKSTRIGHWLLIEWSKLNFRQKQGKLPHAFFMCKTPWNMEEDTPKGTVELIGSISLNRLKQGSSNVITIRKGDYLPGTRTRMQADNFGVEFRHLNNDWSETIDYILNNPPISLDAYPNPYTGKTMPQYKEKEQIVDINKSKLKDTIFNKIKRFLGLK